jgi:hypothetical protein
MLDSSPLVLKRPYLDLRARLETSGLRPSGDPVWILLMSAVFAAAAALSFLAVVILGAPGSAGPVQDPSEVRLKIAVREPPQGPLPSARHGL